MAFDAFKSRRLRASLTILGVVIGVATIVVLISLTQGLAVSVTSLLGKTGTTAINVYPASRGVQLTTKYLTTLEQIDHVVRVVPLIRGMATLKGGGQSLEPVTIIGLDVDALPQVLPDLEVDEGRLYSVNDRVGIVVGKNVAYPPGSDSSFTSVGKIISVKVERAVEGELVTRQKSMLVKGVLSDYGIAMSLLFQVDDGALVSLPAAAMLFGKSRGHYDNLIVLVEAVDYVQGVMDEIERIYGRDLQLISPLQLTQTIQSVINTIQFFLGGIAAISLIVAGIGIANVMYISVMERTRIIGVFKALGAKNRTIMALFLVEALLIGLIGGSLGFGVGVAMAYSASGLLQGYTAAQSPGGQARWSFPGRQPLARPGPQTVTIEPVFTPWLILLALGFAVLVSLLAGFYPARKAAKLDPATALRYE